MVQAKPSELYSKIERERERAFSEGAATYREREDPKARFSTDATLARVSRPDSFSLYIIFSVLSLSSHLFVWEHIFLRAFPQWSLILCLFYFSTSFSSCLFAINWVKKKIRVRSVYKYIQSDEYMQYLLISISKGNSDRKKWKNCHIGI